MPLATAFALLLTSWRGNQRDRHQHGRARWPADRPRWDQQRSSI